MKKLLLSSTALLLFSISILIFQVSCKKSTQAAPQTTLTSTQQNKIIYELQFYQSPTNQYEHAEIWTANYDGSGQQKVNINLPTGYLIYMGDPARLSPDNKTIFFTVIGTSNSYTQTGIYACNFDGTNPHLIVSDSGTVSIATSEAF